MLSPYTESTEDSERWAWAADGFASDGGAAHDRRTDAGGPERIEMSNTETDPREHICTGAEEACGVEILGARAVPLGGPRAMTVHRTLPQRSRSLIGPWCFADHFGPDDVTSTGGMAVPRHPHTGLATVTLLFAGEIEHIDSSGFANTVRPGEVNLMIAGSGISHSEFSRPEKRILHGVQLWYALPSEQRFGTPGSQHHVADSAAVPGGRVSTFLGSCAGLTSPVETRTPAVAAQLDVEPGATLELELDPDSEHGALIDTGDAEICATGTEAAAESAGAREAASAVGAQEASRRVVSRELAYIPPGAMRLSVTARGDEPARAVLIGGPPLGEQIVMWWNFVGRSHDEIIAFRQEWQAEIGREESPAHTGGAGASDTGRAGRSDAGVPADMDFGPFPADTPDPLPAPRLPNARLRPRG